jgi:hypothetical protein
VPLPAAGKRYPSSQCDRVILLSSGQTRSRPAHIWKHSRREGCGSAYAREKRCHRLIIPNHAHVIEVTGDSRLSRPQISHGGSEVSQYPPRVTSIDEPNWGESKDVAQALVKREYANAAGALLGLAASLLGAPAYAIGAVGAAGSMGAGWLWAKLAATSAQARFERARAEYEALDEERRTAFVDRLMRESLVQTRSRLDVELANQLGQESIFSQARMIDDLQHVLTGGDRSRSQASRCVHRNVSQIDRWSAAGARAAPVSALSSPDRSGCSKASIAHWRRRATWTSVA